jgi:heptosyltransferase-2
VTRRSNAGLATRGGGAYIGYAMSEEPRILLVRFSSLGDIVLTTPLLRAIRRKHPRAHVTFATKHRYASLIETNPNISSVAVLAPGESIVAFGRRLAGPSYDHLLDLHGNLRTFMLRRLLAGRWHRCNARRIERRLLTWVGIRTGSLSIPVADRYFEAALDLGVTADGGPAELFTTPRDDENAAAIVQGDYVVLAPGARHATKRWPPSYWRALARAVRDRGIQVVGLGLPHERDLLAGPSAIEAYGLPLRVMVALCRGAKAVVSSDSGVLHVAAAVTTPLVALFGPTVEEFGFSPYRARATVLQRQMPCRPCSLHGGPTCPLDHHRCLRDIAPSEVEEALVEVA